MDSRWWLKNLSRRPYTKIEFSRFEGDPCGWILKVEIFFKHNQTHDDMMVDISAMYLEGDALDLFAWINSECTLLYWKEFGEALQENYSPTEFQNRDEHICSIHQLGTV